MDTFFRQGKNCCCNNIFSLLLDLQRIIAWVLMPYRRVQQKLIVSPYSACGGLFILFIGYIQFYSGIVSNIPPPCHCYDANCHYLLEKKTIFPLLPDLGVRNFLMFHLSHPGIPLSSRAYIMCWYCCTFIIQIFSQ